MSESWRTTPLVTNPSVTQTKKPLFGVTKITNAKAKHGGARPGSGRKPLQPILCDSTALLTNEPKAFLTAVMNEPALDMRMRVDAAKLLLRTEARRSEQTSRAEAQGRTVLVITFA